MASRYGPASKPGPVAGLRRERWPSDRLLSVTFDEARGGYVGTSPELRSVPPSASRLQRLNSGSVIISGSERCFWVEKAFSRHLAGQAVNRRSCTRKSLELAVR
jgi:hypothetical protein